GRPRRPPRLGVPIAVYPARRRWRAVLMLPQVFRPETWWTGVRGHSGHFLMRHRGSSEERAMPFRGVSLMDHRAAFVAAARVEGANVRSLCRAYGISRTTGYKWLSRAAGGDEVLADRSRRPHHSPRRSAAAVEAAVVGVRREHPRWGGRKIHH